MPLIRVGGAGIPLNLTGALGGPLPNESLAPYLQFNPAKGSNAIDLKAGQLMILPSGTYLISPGPYTSIMWLDPVTQIYRSVSTPGDRIPMVIVADGGNYALANTTGCAVGAIVTTTGSGYTNGIGATATGLSFSTNGGAQTWVPVVGGAINSTVSVTAGGANYTYPPILVFDAPPPGGIQATGYCTLSTGAVNAVTVVNQGGGYVTAPNITVINDLRDTTGSGAVLTVNATLASSGSLVALYPSNIGTPVTSVPTLTVSSGSAAATPVMNFVVTGFTAAAGGAGYGNAQPFVVTTIGETLTALGTTAASGTSGSIADVGLTRPRPARILGTSTSGGAITATGAVIIDAGFGIQGVPYGIVLAGGSGTVTTIGQATITVGSIASDRSWVQPI